MNKYKKIPLCKLQILNSVLRSYLLLYFTACWKVGYVARARSLLAQFFFSYFFFTIIETFKKKKNEGANFENPPVPIKERITANLVGEKQNVK